MAAATLDGLARTSIALFEGGEWAALRELVAPEFTSERRWTGHRIEGVRDLIDALVACRTALPDISADVVRLVANEDTVAVEIIWRGTHRGPLLTPAGYVAPTGRVVEFWDTLWQRWHDQRLVHERSHADVLSLLAQVGVSP